MQNYEEVQSREELIDLLEEVDQSIKTLNSKVHELENAACEENLLKRIGMDEETVGSINRLVDYLYRDERKDFESRGEDEVDGHIFLDVERVKKFMDGLS